MTPQTVIAIRSLFVVFIAELFLPVRLSALDVYAPGACFSKPVKSFKELRSKDIVPQSLDYSCGPAAMATLLSYYFNDPVPEREIIRYLLMTGDLARIKARKGFSLLDLKKYCRYRGYQVTGYKGDLEFFAKLNKPVLVPVTIKDYSHFVVMRGVKDGRVFIADPAMGRMTMLVPKFLVIWQSGVGLVLSKDGEERLKEAPLALSDDEDAVKADAAALKNGIGREGLGRILGQGEF